MRTRREMNGALAAAAAAMLAGFRPAGANPQPGGDAARITGPLPAQSRREAARARARPAGVRVLLREPLAEMPHAQVTMITLSLPPGSNAPPHRHTGPVFAYVLEGEIENQVEPDPPRRYRPGDSFYEPPMHIHRMLRNLSRTRTAKLLICEVGEAGRPFTIPA
jgi:quercetin dioxygenase-like cupin family protein